MPQRAKNDRRSQVSARQFKAETLSRLTVALAPSIARRVERFAETADTSMSKALATLVRLGLEGQQARKAEFMERLKTNLASEDPKEQERLIDEFRDLILGR
jgi:hypothetical protein